MRIREVREQQNIKQNALAAMLQMAPNTLSQYETGKREPDLATVQKIAEALNVSVDYLLGGKETKEMPASVSTDGQSDKLAKALDGVGINVDTLSEAEINKIAQLAKVALEN